MNVASRRGRPGMTTRAIRPMARMLPRAMWPSTEIPPRVPGTPSFLCQADLCEISMVSPNSPKRRKILPRFGAIGKHGSIAVIERFIRTFKAEGLRRLILLPLGAAELNREIRLYVQWFNAYRAHTARTARRRMSDIGALRQPAAGRDWNPAHVGPETRSRRATGQGPRRSGREVRPPRRISGRPQALAHRLAQTRGVTPTSVPAF